MPGARRVEGLDLPGDELGVVLDPAEERGAARVLPGEAEEVEARDIGDAPPVADAAVSRLKIGNLIQA